MNIKPNTYNNVPIWGIGLGLFLLTWAYWAGLIEMSEVWKRDPQYSHGSLVPLIALGLLWYRYDMLGMGRPQGRRLGWGLLVFAISVLFLLPHSVVAAWGFVAVWAAIVGAGLLLIPTKLESRQFQPTWWGMPLLVVGIALLLYAGHYYITWFSQLSIVPMLAGLVLLTIGWHGFRWGWPAILFVGFMVPLPHTLQGMLRGPLRMVGTKASTYLMQTCNLPAFADGNRHEIIVGGMSHRIGVDEACSGMAMLIIFFALSTAVAVVIQRTIWERILITLTAVPIAIIANVVRITITGMMLYYLEGRNVYLGVGNLVFLDMDGAEFASSFFHDWAGWLMMPLALGLLWVELALLKRIIIVEQDAPMTVAISSTTSKAETIPANNPATLPTDSAVKPPDTISKTAASGTQSTTARDSQSSAAVRGTT